jgi:hypothetical protein
MIMVFTFGRSTPVSMIAVRAPGRRSGRSMKRTITVFELIVLHLAVRHRETRAPGPSLLQGVGEPLVDGLDAVVDHEDALTAARRSR